MYLIDPNMPQFQGNLHTHSTLSDGKLTPTEEEAVADSPYFRLSVFGPDGESACTRPYRRSEII